MSSNGGAFTHYSRCFDDHVGVCAPNFHTVPYITGGLNKLYQIIKSDEVPDLPEYGYYTNKNGQFDPQEPCLMGLRYQVKKILESNGRSAVMVLAEDMYASNKLVVIKVLHSEYYKLGTQESHILWRLAVLDPINHSHTLRLLTTLTFDSHYCMVFEPLLPDPLTDVFKQISPHKILACMRKVSLRILASVGFLHQQNMIHADLKPDNILLKYENDLDSVHIVDFGNTIHCVHSEMSMYYKDFELQTPLYRAPEVMFGVHFGQEIDMWSLGCILAELYTGQPLFLGTTNDEILQQVTQLLGSFPAKIFMRGKYYKQLEKYTGDEEQCCATLKLMEHLQCRDMLFADLIANLLRYNPAERFTASQAAAHPFFASHFPLAFLLPQASGVSSSNYLSVCASPKVYNYLPKIAADIRKRQPSSVELLKMGTSELPFLDETTIHKPSPRYKIMNGRKDKASTTKLNLDVAYSSKPIVKIVSKKIEMPGNKYSNPETKKADMKTMQAALLKAIHEEQDFVEEDLERIDHESELKLSKKYISVNKAKPCKDKGSRLTLESKTSLVKQNLHSYGARFEKTKYKGATSSTTDVVIKAKSVQEVISSDEEDCRPPEVMNTLSEIAPEDKRKIYNSKSNSDSIEEFDFTENRSSFYETSPGKRGSKASDRNRKQALQTSGLLEYSPTCSPVHTKPHNISSPSNRNRKQALQTSGLIEFSPTCSPVHTKQHKISSPSKRRISNTSDNFNTFTATFRNKSSKICSQNTQRRDSSNECLWRSELVSPSGRSKIMSNKNGIEKFSYNTCQFSERDATSLPEQRNKYIKEQMEKKLGQRMKGKKRRGSESTSDEEIIQLLSPAMERTQKKRLKQNMQNDKYHDSVACNSPYKSDNCARNSCEEGFKQNYPAFETRTSMEHIEKNRLIKPSLKQKQEQKIRKTETAKKEMDTNKDQIIPEYIWNNMLQSRGQSGIQKCTQNYQNERNQQLSLHQRSFSNISMDSEYTMIDKHEVSEQFDKNDMSSGQSVSWRQVSKSSDDLQLTPRSSLKRTAQYSSSDIAVKFIKLKNCALPTPIAMQNERPHAMIEDMSESPEILYKDKSKTKYLKSKSSSSQRCSVSTSDNGRQRSTCSSRNDERICTITQQQRLKQKKELDKKTRRNQMGLKEKLLLNRPKSNASHMKEGFKFQKHSGMEREVAATETKTITTDDPFMFTGTPGTELKHLSQGDGIAKRIAEKGRKGKKRARKSLVFQKQQSEVSDNSHHRHLYVSDEEEVDNTEHKTCDSFTCSDQDEFDDKSVKSKNTKSMQHRQGKVIESSKSAVNKLCHDKDITNSENPNNIDYSRKQSSHQKRELNTVAAYTSRRKYAKSGSSAKVNFQKKSAMDSTFTLDFESPLKVKKTANYQSIIKTGK